MTTPDFSGQTGGVLVCPFAGQRHGQRHGACSCDSCDEMLKDGRYGVLCGDPGAALF